MSYVNAQIKAGAEKDVLVFCGSGATGAIHKFVRLLELESLPDRAVVFVGAHEHHSNLLPWRAVAEVVTIPLLPDGRLDLEFLRGRLKLFQERSLKIGAFSAASNLTGILQDTDTITELLHQFGALACWDYAAASPYVRVDMNPVLPGRDSELLRKDAIFLSPHKFVGGIGAPGILVAKKRLFQRSKEDKKQPHDAGGGTVFFVDTTEQVYEKRAFLREEAGTPDIIGCIRAGLTFRLKHWLGGDFLAQELAIWQRVRGLFAEEDKLVLLGPAESPRLPIFCFLVRFGDTFLHHNFVGRLLSDLFGIQGRSGCMCAGPYAQQLLGLTPDETKLFQSALLLADENEWVRPGFTRLSLPFFTSEAEVTYVLQALRFVAQHGWRFLPQYSLRADTGEFSHISFRSVPRWFSSHPFVVAEDEAAGGPTGPATSEPKRRRTDATVALSYEALLAEAERQLEECERVVRHVTPATTLPYVNSETAALKWCLFPSEALLLLRKQSVNLQPSLLIRPNNGLATTSQSEAKPEPSPANNNDKNPNPTAGGKGGGSTGGKKGKKMTIPKKQILIPVRKAMTDFDMLQAGDRILLGLSGGKDSLTLLHVLLFLKRKSQRSPTSFSSSSLSNSSFLPPQSQPDFVELGTSALQLPTFPLPSLPLPLRWLSNTLPSPHLSSHHLPYSPHLPLGTLPVKFELGVCTIDPGSEAYDPRPLKAYVTGLGLPYFFESERIMDSAMDVCPTSICSWCARMKRGTLYTVARREG
jgi:selenocysteine lyase/cysteine desulfurase